MKQPYESLSVCAFLNIMKKEEYMTLALEEAKLAFKEDEVPIGCIIVKDREIIASSHNQKEKEKNATRHAEIIAIEEASKYLNNWHLDDCEIFVTLEPCIMCTGAIINSRIKKIYFGAKDPKGGALESNLKIKKVEGLNHYPEYESGILEKECSDILKEFFKRKR